MWPIIWFSDALSLFSVFIIPQTIHINYLFVCLCVFVFFVLNLHFTGFVGGESEDILGGPQNFKGLFEGLRFGFRVVL